MEILYSKQWFWENQSTEGADVGGCWKLRRPLELIEI